MTKSMKKKSKTLCKISFDELTIEQTLDLPFENKFKSNIIESIAQKINKESIAWEDYVAGWMLIIDPDDLPTSLVKESSRLNKGDLLTVKK